jgi:hypothetical protein
MCALDVVGAIGGFGGRARRGRVDGDVGRVRRCVYTEEERRYLRVVLLADRETVHNAFFDRRFNP